MVNTRSNGDGFKGEYPKPLNLEPDTEQLEQKAEDDDDDS